MGNDLEKKRAQVGAIPAVRVIPHYEDEKSFFKDLTVSKTITGAAGLMGEVANVNIIGISIIPTDGKIHYNPATGAATITNAQFLTGTPYSIWGDKVALDKVTLIAASGTVKVSIITHVLITS